MIGILTKLRRGVERLAQGCRFLGQLALALMVISICYDVLMRYIFAAPTTWSLEINTFLVIFVTLIPAADVLRTDDHLRIKFFLERFPPFAQKAVAVLTAVLGCGFCALMTWKGWNMAWEAYRYDERMSTALGTPLVIPYLFIPTGFALLFLQFGVSLLDQLGMVTDKSAGKC